MIGYVPESLRATHWQKNAQLYTQIPDFGQGGLARVLQARASSGSLDLAALVIPEGERVVGCMDGGVQHQRLLGMGGAGTLHLPNFLRHKLRKTRVIPTEERRLLDQFAQMPFKGFTGHPGCGAGEISLNEVYGLPPGTHTDPGTIDQYSAEATALVAQATGKPYLGEVKLSRPDGFHPTNLIIYAAIAINGPRFVAGIGLGVIDDPMSVYRPAHVYPETAVRDIDVAVREVLMGPKGHGPRFTPQTPLGIILVGSRQIPLEQLRKEVFPIQQAFAGRIAVDGFEFPS